MTNQSTPVASEQTTLKALENKLAEINALNDFLHQKLTKDQDWNAYAFGNSKPRPTLLKGGAEKVAKLIGVNQVNFDVHIDQPDGVFAVSVVCNMTSPTASCQGVGYASSLESKWAKYDKETGKYTSQPNTFNTVMKIAKKRAYVDCVLTMSGLSGYFTQDLEDMEGATKSTARTTQNAKAGAKPSATKTNATSAKKDAEFDREFDSQAEPVQVVDEDTGEIVSEDGVTDWDDLISDSDLYCNYCGEQVSEKVRDYSKQKFGMTVCYKCQQAQKAS